MNYRRKMAGLLLAGAALTGTGMVGVGAGPAQAASPTTGGSTNVTVDGFYELRNVGTQKCADVENESLQSGAEVHQWSCQGHNNQLWKPVTVPGIPDDVYLLNRNSSFCLDVRPPAGYSPPNGTRVEQDFCGQDLSTVWHFVPVTAPKYAYTVFKVVSANSGKCLDLDEGSSSNGQRIQVWDCQANNVHQQWRLV